MDIEKAWKDPDYRATLTEAEVAQLPENPAGATTLDAQQLKQVHGGTLDPITASVSLWVTCGMTVTLQPGVCGATP